MTATYYVIKQAACPECRGTGVVTHPAWAQYHASHRLHDRIMPPSQESIEQWFRDEAGYDYPPDEEIPCPECKGAGTLRQETELTEVLEGWLEKITTLERSLQHLITPDYELKESEAWWNS